MKIVMISLQVLVDEGLGVIFGSDNGTVVFRTRGIVSELAKMGRKLCGANPHAGTGAEG